MLDRDCYPTAYLQDVGDLLNKAKMGLVLTPGKEIENVLLEGGVIFDLCPAELHA